MTDCRILSAFLYLRGECAFLDFHLMYSFDFACRGMKGPHGDDLFMSCISELVLETREVSGYFIHPVSNI